MSTSRTCASTTTGTVWRPDSGASPATAEPKATKWRLGWRAIVCLHSRRRKTCSKAGRPAVLNGRRRRQSGWKGGVSYWTSQVVCGGDTVLIRWLNYSSWGWLVCKLNDQKQITYHEDGVLIWWTEVRAWRRICEGAPSWNVTQMYCSRVAKTVH